MASSKGTASTGKAGDKVTLADGSTGYVTQGGHIRVDSGPNKGKLWQGAAPGAAPAPAPAAAAPQGNTSSPNAPLPTAFGNGPIPGGAPEGTAGKIANAQYGADKQYISDQMQANRLDEISPFGTQQYIQGPDGNQIKVNSIGGVDPLTSLGWQGEQYQNQSYIDRALQAIAGEGGVNNQGQAGLLPQLRGMFSSSLDFNKAPAAANPNDFQANRSHVEDSLYNRFATVNEPQFQKQREQFEQSMANRGIPLGSKLYNDQLLELNRSQQDARDAARTNSIGLGGQEQQRLYEDSNTSRNNAISEQITQRNQPLTDLRGLLSAVNPLQLPQFNATSNVNVAQNPYSQLADNSLNRATNLQTAQFGPNAAIEAAHIGAESALAQGSQQFQNQQALAQQQFGYNQQLQNQGSGSGSLWGNLGGAALGGFLGGLGNTAGQGAFNWGSGLFK